MHRRSGFTIIEVSLVIAITAILFIAFITTIGSSLAPRRYRDSALNFAEFLRQSYSAVINVQNNNYGNSDQAIYGRLLTFGEGATPAELASGIAVDSVRSYDVIGKAVNSDTLNSTSNLRNMLKNVVQISPFERNTQLNVCTPVNESTYSLTYGAWLETTDFREDDEGITKGAGIPFTGSILIIRSPIDGIVNTFYSADIIDVQEYAGSTCTSSDSLTTKILANKLETFSSQEINFCIGSDYQPAPDIRRNVRITKNGSSSSAVQILNQDEGDNKCNH